MNIHTAQYPSGEIKGFFNLSTGAQTVAVGCPFCLTMLGDGVTGKKAGGEAGENVEVVDVATVLLRSVKP